MHSALWDARSTLACVHPTLLRAELLLRRVPEDWAWWFLSTAHIRFV
jgi:hypothetical protein